MKSASGTELKAVVEEARSQVPNDMLRDACDSMPSHFLNARDLLPLDPTGFSDPFVIIELVPRHFFPNCVKQRTKVQKKTLFPLFDEAFE
ncbi:hypothetical protein AVEN_108282-1, partial [Araneus ventricosus]